MDDVRGLFLGMPLGTTPAAVTTNKNIIMSPFKSSGDIQKKKGFLRRTLFSCPQNVKEAAYKGMVRPILEYGSSVWDPRTGKLQEHDKFEKS